LGVTAKNSIVQLGAGLLLLAGMAVCRAAGPANAQTIERPDPAIAEQILVLSKPAARPVVAA